MERLRATIPTGFTLHESMDHVNIELKREGDGPVQPKHTQLWSGARLVSSDEKVVAHFMRFGVYVSFLAYRNFEEALPLVQRLWEAYIKAFTRSWSIASLFGTSICSSCRSKMAKWTSKNIFKCTLSSRGVDEHLGTLSSTIVILDPNSGFMTCNDLNQREEDGNLVVAFDLEGYQERQWTPEDGVIWDDFLGPELDLSISEQPLPMHA